MSLLLPHASDLSSADHEIIANAYEVACDQLVEENGLTPAQLAELIEPMAESLLVMFRIGQRDEGSLARYEAQQKSLTMDVSEIIERLFDLADHGERDPHKLRAAALGLAA